MAVLGFFEQVERELRTDLTMERLLMLREQTVQAAATRVDCSAAVAHLFKHLLEGASPAQALEV